MGLAPNPSNKSMTGVACAECEGEEEVKSPSSDADGALLSCREDKISGEDELVCVGGVPIDNRSRRTSVPFCGTGFIPITKPITKPGWGKRRKIKLAREEHGVVCDLVHAKQTGLV